MYSYEIQELLELKQYILEAKEYLRILDTSPQIINTHYDNYTDDFYIETEDRYNFKFKVKRKEEK